MLFWRGGNKKPAGGGLWILGAGLFTESVLYGNEQDDGSRERKIQACAFKFLNEGRLEGANKKCGSGRGTGH